MVLRSACICMRGLRMRQSESVQHFTQGAEDSMRRSPGLGGCPFAQDILVGNIPTEVVMAELRRCGASLPAFGSLDTLIAASHDIASRFGSVVQ